MRKRIIISALLSVCAMLITLGIVSDISVQDEIENSLERNLELASITAGYVDYLLRTNLARLYDVSLAGAVDFSDRDWDSERAALKTAYQYSIFSEGLFLLDSSGRVVLTYPRTQISARDLADVPDMGRVLEEGKPLFTGIRTLNGSGRKTIFALAPLKNKTGATVGLIGGEISPANYFLINAVRSLSGNGQTVIELVDADGVIIASNNPSRVFACADRNRILANLISSHRKGVFKCHRCHLQDRPLESAPEVTEDMLAFSSLSEAPWGVAVREPEARVFAPSYYLKKRFAVLGLVVIASAFALGFAISRSVVNPIQTLTRAAQRIAAGKLDEPVQTNSKDEIGALSRSFETMRARLFESVGSIRRYNQELEERVEDRTREIVQNRQRLSRLLFKLIKAQEDERLRIARELHDESMQSAAALGLSLELSAFALRENRLTEADLMALKKSVDELIDGMNRIIQNLRPPMLEDLGFESALKWLLEKQLKPRGIQYQLRVSDSFTRRLELAAGGKRRARYELMLFRILQEGISNVAKHSGADRAQISLVGAEDGLQLMVQDNGVGFDVDRVFAEIDDGTSESYGVLGLKERVTLLGGDLEIESSPNSGTRVTATIPVKVEDQHESDSSDDRG